MTARTILRPVMAVVLGVGFVWSATTLRAVPAVADEKPKTTEVKIKDIKLTVPATWKQKPPSNKLRLAQFTIPAATDVKEPTELVVYSFGGGGGGAKANIGRWIAQFATKGRKANVTSGKSPQGQYIMVDITGTYNMPVGPPVLRKTKPLPEARMLAVILAVEKKGNYFLKLVGPQASADAAAAALRASFGGDAKSEKPYDFDGDN